jgi:preprotein translocase subunit YajC
MGSQAGQAQGGSSQWMGLLPLVLLFVVFYFLLIRPQQKKAKQHKQFIENLKKGDEVVTAGGMYGKITGITENAVTLQIAEGVRIKVTKGSVADIVKGE